MIITICGSKKFANEIYHKADILRSYGNTVYTPMFNTCKSIEELVQVHKYKILASDVVLICNYNGYIGEHTQNEIDFAKQCNKLILFTDHLY